MIYPLIFIIYIYIAIEEMLSLFKVLKVTSRMICVLSTHFRREFIIYIWAGVKNKMWQYAWFLDNLHIPDNYLHLILSKGPKVSSRVICVHSAHSWRDFIIHIVPMYFLHIPFSLLHKYIFKIQLHEVIKFFFSELQVLIRYEYIGTLGIEEDM